MDKTQRILLSVAFICLGAIIGWGVLPILFVRLDVILFGKEIGPLAMTSLTLAPILGAAVGSFIGLIIAILYTKRK